MLTDTLPPETTCEEINAMILTTLRELVIGQCKIARANAIFNGIRLLQMQRDMEPSGEGPIASESETADFQTLLHHLHQHDHRREWHSPEIRAAAVRLGLFRQWLTLDNADSFSSMSRFGLLCDRQLNRNHNGLSLVRQGYGRSRVYTIASK